MKIVVSWMRACKSGFKLALKKELFKDAIIIISSGVSDDSGASSPVDFDNVVGMAEALQAKLSSTVALPHFASLLQHLFMVSE